jgi:hypothetical protein
MHKLETPAPDLDVERLLAALEESLTYLPKFAQKAAEVSLQSLSLLLEFAEKNLNDSRKVPRQTAAPLSVEVQLTKKLITQVQSSTYELCWS